MFIGAGSTVRAGIPETNTSDCIPFCRLLFYVTAF